MSSNLVGALLVLAGSTALGNQMALTFRRRPMDLAHCQLCLQVLLTEIEYGLTPLPEALRRAAGAARGPAAAAFARAAEQLETKPGITPRQAWLEAWALAAGEAALTAPDLEVLAGLAPSLGASDRHQQRRHLLLCSQRLAAAEKAARAGAEQNLRLYRYLGLLAGAFLAALLL